MGTFGCGGGLEGRVVMVGVTRLEESQGAEALVRVAAAAYTLPAGRGCGVRSSEGEVFVQRHLWRERERGGVVR